MWCIILLWRVLFGLDFVLVQFPGRRFLAGRCRIGLTFLFAWFRKFLPWVVLFDRGGGFLRRRRHRQSARFGWRDLASTLWERRGSRWRRDRRGVHRRRLIRGYMDMSWNALEKAWRACASEWYISPLACGRDFWDIGFWFVAIFWLSVLWNGHIVTVLRQKRVFGVLSSSNLNSLSPNTL